MTYECVGCGQVDKNSPPTNVMPRIILGHSTQIVCSSCKQDLEEYLGRQLSRWCSERQDLIKLDKSRRENTQN